MSEPFRSRFRVAFAAAGFLCCTCLTGCKGTPHGAGNDLPVVGTDSRALPGSTNAADAPEAPRTVNNAPDTVTFHDPGTGITFRYPGDWRPLSPAGPLPVPAFAAAAGPALGTEAFSPAGTPYARTNLAGLSFGWTVRPGTSSAACTALATRALQSGSTRSETVNGVSYTRVDGNDAGMCHRRAATIDAAVHNDRCYLFERDLDTICPDTKGPGQDVALTEAQRATLQAELAAVLASVQLQ